MASSLASFVAGLSIVTLGFAAYQLGRAVRRLQDELDENAAAAQPKAVSTGGRAMFSGLYPVDGSKQEESIPGFRFIVAAGGLGLVSLLLGLLPSTPAAPSVSPEVIALGARVDSLALSFAQRRAADSMAAARAPAPHSAAPRRTERAVAARVAVPTAIPAAILPDTTPIRIP